MLKTLSVSELSYYISNIFEAEELLHNVKVYGEVSGVSCVRGNLYFTLKDENSIMPCIMFGASSLLKEGDQVLATGTIKYYGKGGKLNLYVTSAIPYGSGLLYQKFLELKSKLEEEGIFSSKYKKPFPKEIKNIGVISSKTGAVIHDIQTVAHRRNPCLNIFIYPAKVQGIGAEQTIIKGLEYFDKQQDVDAIIIARGGGSIEDLQPFNTEVLARAIINCSKPVVSAVGHETDFTICDFASTIRAATPSEGAELVSKNIFEEFKKILNSVDRMSYQIDNLLEDNFQKIDNKKEKLFKQIKFNFNQKSYELKNFVQRLSGLSKTIYTKTENDLNLVANKLKLLNPQEVLNRGFIRITKNDNLIKSIDCFENNDELVLEFVDGKAKTKVIEKRRDI